MKDPLKDPVMDKTPEKMPEKTSEEIEKGPEKEAELGRKLSPLNVWALAFGCTIGWGAFIMPGTAFLKRAGPLGSMLALEAGAFVMLLISYSYYYMLRRFPVNGGQYIYAKMAFGRVHGFICAWFLGLCYLCVIPLNATALGLLGRILLRDSLQFGFHYTVAGYDVWLGELLLAIVPMVLLAFASALGVRFAGWLQTVLAVLLLGGVLAVVAAVVFHSRDLTGNLRPLFQSGEGALLQIFAVAVTAPQLFVGFETPPLMAEESRFDLDRTKVIMDTCIVCSAFVYIALTFLAAAVPVGYLDWRGYIYDLPYKQGVMSVPTLYAAYRMLGDLGIGVWTVATLAAMLTGIVGFYTVTSRLLHSLARDRMIPSWFGRLNRNSVPFNATLFCMAMAVFAPFMGRTVLNWAFDMASLGGTISFGYVCLAARKYALKEGRTDMVILGSLGAAFSAVLAFFLMVPIPALGCSISLESYICLALWSVLGAVFFLRRRIFLKNRGE